MVCNGSMIIESVAVGATEYAKRRRWLHQFASMYKSRIAPVLAVASSVAAQLDEICSLSDVGQALQDAARAKKLEITKSVKQLESELQRIDDAQTWEKNLEKAGAGQLQLAGKSSLSLSLRELEGELVPSAKALLGGGRTGAASTEDTLAAEKGVDGDDGSDDGEEVLSSMGLRVGMKCMVQDYNTSRGPPLLATVLDKSKRGVLVAFDHNGRQQDTLVTDVSPITNAPKTEQADGENLAWNHWLGPRRRLRRHGPKGKEAWPRDTKDGKDGKRVKVQSEVAGRRGGRKGRS